MIPGLPNQVSGQGSVPGLPDPSGEASKATAGGDQVVQALMQILQQSNRPHVQGQAPAVPGGPQQQSTTPPEYMTSGPAKHSWGPERFLYTLGATINNIGAQKQQRELAHATNQYSALMTSLDKYVGPDGKISPQAYQDPSVMAILGNDKELKKMAKSLQTDWLNPQKTTPYQQALGQAIQKRQKQQQARTGMDKMFHDLVNKATKPKVDMTDQQKQGMAQEVGSKTPTTGGVSDPKDAIAALEQINKMNQHVDTMNLERDKLKATAQEHVDSLQERYDAMNEHADEFRQTLRDRRANAADRQAAADSLAKYRQDSLQLRRDLAKSKLSVAETPKDRQAWVNNELKDLMASRASAAKDVQDSNKKWFAGMRGLPEAKSTLDMYNTQIKNLQSVAEDVRMGKITTSDAISKIYGADTQTPKPAAPPVAPGSVDDEIMKAVGGVGP